MDGRMLLEEESWSVVPEYDVSIPKAAEGVEKKVSPHLSQLVEQANRAVVWDEVSLSSASDLTRVIRLALKSLEEERTTITGPINKGLKALNDKFKLISKPLSDAQRVLDGKMIEFQMQEKRRLEALALNARQEALIVGETVPVVESEGRGLKIRGEFSSATMVDHWVFEVVDIAKVPDRFLKVVPNEEEIKAAIKAGVREIGGIKIENKPYLLSK